VSDNAARWIFKLHLFCMGLQKKRPLFASLGATGVTYLMGYCYMMTLQQGAKAEHDRTNNRTD